MGFISKLKPLLAELDLQVCSRAADYDDDSGQFVAALLVDTEQF